LRRRDVFTALADPTRRRILDLLRDSGPLNAGAIAASFRRATRPAISRHLRVLRECRLVVTESKGREKLSALDPRPIVRARDGWLATFSESHRESLKALRRIVERGAV
jgi:DNA-binding transcriptional ArsR family regulator